MWTKNMLVVANATATSDDLRAALRAQAVTAPTAFHLIVPASSLAGERAVARDRLHALI
jgi:hypothetical protein